MRLPTWSIQVWVVMKSLDAVGCCFHCSLFLGVPVNGYPLHEVKNVCNEGGILGSFCCTHRFYAGMTDSNNQND
jgi:hypothetical protein